jgi:DNA invertase Pin-like site-specific DNA recombinase
MRLLGYARTSTCLQDAGLEAQIRDLTAIGCDVIYNEQVSSVGERPEFDAAMADLKPGDTLVVTKMDRLARSIVGLLQIVEDLNGRGIALRILNLGGDVVDTKSATGRLMLSMLASFAQFEREIMLERQREGIVKAQIEGKYRGRKPTSMEKRERVIEMHADGRSVIEIARDIGISRITVYRILQSEGLCDVPTRGHPYRRFVPRRMDAQGALPAA